MALVELELDVPDGIRVSGYEYVEGGHAMQVDWDLPSDVTCDKCRQCQPIQLELAAKFTVIRDLDIQGKPAFFVYQAAYHRCPRFTHRQWLVPPFKRKHSTVSFRFEEHVLQLLIGSTEEDVARRMGISAEMVRQIVNHRLKDQREIDPNRVITDVYDEISLKKRHKLYVTILTDLTDPKRPQILAVAKGRDQAAAEKCLSHLSETQREQVQTHRTDMSPAYLSAGKKMLPNSQNVVDRFHVAQKLGEVVDSVRKKNSRLQSHVDEERAEEFSFSDVGVPQTA